MPTTHTTEERVPVATGVTLAVRVHRPGAPLPTDATTDSEPAPVLAVHGLSSNARLWDGVAEALTAAGHTVAAVDQRGHGRSDKPDDGYDYATLTADLVAVLDHLGWGAPVVAGQSFGANVAVEFAARHRDRTAAVVLVDGGTIDLSGRFADWPTAEAALTPPALAGTPWEQVERWIRGAHPDWPEAGIEATLANLEHLPDGTARPWLSLPHHMAILRTMWDNHPADRWPDLDLPVCIIPAEDPSGPGGRFDAGKRDEVERARRSLPKAVVRWMAGDHDLHAQHPAAVAELIHRTATGALFTPMEHA